MSELGNAPVGAVIGTVMHPAGIIDLAKQCEEQGFSELWFSEDHFYTGGVAGAASALAVTERVPVGFGITSAPVRHPAILATELSTLAHLHPSRVRPGIALGGTDSLRRMGLSPSSQLAAVRECVVAVRRLLAGEELNEEGEVFSLDSIKLTYPVGELPIHVGGVGPRMVRLSGEVGDGTIGSVMAGTDYISWARERIAEGQASAGRSGHHPFFAFAIFSCDHDAAKAKATARGILAFFFATLGHSALTDVYGIHDELDALLSSDPLEMPGAIPEQWIEDLAIAGDPDECAAKIQAYLDAGADSVSLFPVPGEAAAAQFELAAREILPVVSPLPRP